MTQVMQHPSDDKVTSSRLQHSQDRTDDTWMLEIHRSEEKATASPNRSSTDQYGGFSSHDEGKYQSEVQILQHDPSPADLQRLTAQELGQLTFNEREEIFEEIHGVRPILEETAELVTTKLALMDQELEKLSMDRSAFDFAMATNSDYVRSLRLMFLRTDRFRAERAAKRMIDFFDKKLNLFGIDSLARPLYLSDLDEEDLSCLRAGHIQMLPVRDRIGRVVLCDIQDVLHRQNYIWTSKK